MCPSLKSCISNKSLESISKLLTSEINMNANKQSSNDYQDSNNNSLLSISPKNNSIQYGTYLSCDNNINSTNSSLSATSSANNNQSLNANNSNINNNTSGNNSSTASILIPVSNNQNSTNSPNGANNNTLQMIQEEQNEISMISSESSSLSSSVSTTPRLSRSSIGSGNTKTMLFNPDPTPGYPKSYMNIGRQTMSSGEGESTHANDMNPYDVMDHVESNLIENEPLKAESLIENLLAANQQNSNKNKNFCNGNLDDNDTCYFKKSKKTFTKHTC